MQKEFKKYLQIIRKLKNFFPHLLYVLIAVLKEY